MTWRLSKCRLGMKQLKPKALVDTGCTMSIVRRWLVTNLHDFKEKVYYFDGRVTVCEGFGLGGNVNSRRQNGDDSNEHRRTYEWD